MMTAQLEAERPTIKILLYTDDPNAISQGRNLLGLSSMIDRLNAHAPAFADLSIKWMSRSSDQDHHADNKLNVVMSREVEQTGEPFDEIWFFGLHQANTERFSLRVSRGGPESELDADEVAALEQWMKINRANGSGGGGVLMTGDHNNPVPRNRIASINRGCADTVSEPALLGLGRALGRCVPRAGALRKWDGPPSFRPQESLSTLASTGFQTDRVPQKLILQPVNEAGEPDSQGKPHPLFMYQPGTFIDVFPDHGHEGALVIPDLLDETVWPIGPNGQPRPFVVASGTDKRNDERVSLVSAYDGDGAGVGRIVADSSWHHYVNINLKGFPHPAPANSISDKIGQFYGNLAVWLAPLHKRRQMARAMYWELADYTFLLEEQNSPRLTGEIAYSLLQRAASACEIRELLQAFADQQSTRSFSASTVSLNGNADQQVLGSVLDSYHQAMISLDESTRSSDPANVVAQGFRRAFAAPANSLRTRRSTPGTRSSQLQKRSRNMTCAQGQIEWTIHFLGDQPPLDEILRFCLNSQNGVVNGEASSAEGTFLSPVTGSEIVIDPDLSFMELNFKWGEPNVLLSGTTFRTDATVEFKGRFRAFALTEADSNGNIRSLDETLPLGPGSGDTGTGTGQQT